MVQANTSTEARIDADLPVALFRIARQLRAAAVATGDDVWMVMLLRQVLVHEPLRLSALAGCVGLDASTVSRHVKRLEDAGYVARTEDPADRRASRLVTTEPGRALLDRAMRAYTAVIAHAVADWSDEDRILLPTLVNRLAGALDRVAAERETHGDTNHRS